MTTKNKSFGNEEEEVEAVTSPGKAFNDIIFEQTANNTYLVYSRSEDKFIIKNDSWHVYEHKGVRYFPLRRVPWPLAYIPKDYDSEEQLFNETRSFLIEHLDVANDLFLALCFITPLQPSLKESLQEVQGNHQTC